MIKLSEKRKENIAPIPGNILFLSLAAILTFNIRQVGLHYLEQGY